MGFMGMPDGPESFLHIFRDRQMPKLKNKSSAKKRFRLTAKGKVRFASANLNHMLRRRSQKMKRTNRGTQIMSASDAKVVKRHYLRVS